MSGGSPAQLVETRLHGVGDLHRVGPRLLLDEEADGVLSVEPGEAPRLFDRVLGPAHVADADRIAVAVGDDQVVELFSRLDAAQRPEHELARPLLHDAAGNFEVLPQDGLPHVLDRQVVRGEVIGVDDDVDRPRAAAGEEDGTDAGDRLQDLLDAVLGDLGHFAHVAPPRDADGDDRAGVEVEGVDKRRLHPLRELVDDGGDLVTHFLRGDVAVLFEHEHGDDGRRAFADDRAGLVDARDRVDRLLDGAGDGCFQLFGAGPRQRGRHRNDRDVGLRKEIHPQEHIRDDPQHDGHRDEHPREDRPTNANFGDGHGSRGQGSGVREKRGKEVEGGVAACGRFILVFLIPDPWPLIPCP